MGPTSKGGDEGNEGEGEEKEGGRGLAPRRNFLAPPQQITEEIVS